MKSWILGPCILALVGPLTAQTISLEAAGDTYLKSGSPNKSQGGEGALRVQSSGHNRSLVRFDQAAIAAAVAGGSLASASLELFIQDNADNWGADGRTVDVHRLSVAWTETGVTWNCPVDANSGNSSPDCAVQWNGGSFEEEPSDTLLHTNGLVGWVSFDVTGDVQGFLEGAANYGWLVKKTEEGQNGRVDYTSRQGAAGQAPRLVLVVESAAFDEVPPSLAVTAPSRSVVVNDPTPEIVVEYEDGGAGVDLGSLSVEVDGDDVTASCVVGPASAVCEPSALAGGGHVVTARIADLAGNVAEASRGFELLLGPGMASATVAVVADTYLRQGQPNQNQGSEGVLRVRQSGKNRALLRVDPAEVAALVAGATVHSARLELFIEENGDNWGRDGRTVDLHRLTASWSEHGATWNCADDAEPGNQQANCDPQWNGGSFEAVPTATVLHTNGLEGAVEFDVTADIAAFLAGEPDHGWLLKKTDEGQSGLVEYVSREGAVEASPKLVVTFEVPGGGSDETPPSVAIESPSDGSFLGSAKPPVVARYTDGESGIDTTAVALFLDGVDRTDQAEVTSSGLTFPLPDDDLPDGPHSVLVRIGDVAGNLAQAGVTFTLDSAPPEVAIVSPAGPIVNDETAPLITVTFADALAGIEPSSLRVQVNGSEITGACVVVTGEARCAPPALAAGEHSVRASVADIAGNVGIASHTFTLVLDQTPPELAIVAPAGPVVLGDATPEVRATYADTGSGIDLASLQILVDGNAITAGCAVGPAEAVCEAPVLGRGSHIVAAAVADLPGNTASATLAIAVSLPVEIGLTAPLPDTVVGVPVVAVAGTVAPNAVAVHVNGVAAVLGDGEFSIAGLGLHDGVNHLVAVARDAAGNVGTATVRVFADTTPPQVAISSPTDGGLTSAPTITVTGLVNDLTLGTVSETEVTVTVNGSPAVVANRSFLAASVPLALGDNVLTAEAIDRAGNQATATALVTRLDRTGAPTLIAVSGDGQTAAIGEPLPQPMVVRVLDAAGQPQPDAQVVFRVVQGDGAFADDRRLVVATTGPSGEAQASWRLGNRAGVGVDRVSATAVGVVGEMLFTAATDPGPAEMIHVASGGNQRGAVGADLPQPLVAVVFDSGGNPLSGVPVTFQIAAGGGSVAGADEVTVTTDQSGLAATSWRLGSTPGLDNHLVEARFPGLASEAATFKASAFVPGDPAATELVGVVLDNQGAPVPGVTLRLRDTPNMTVADAEGQFRLTGVPVGRVFLIADATTTTRPGQWASLEFELFTVAGVANTLDRPIYVLPLDLAGGIFVDETHGGVVTIANVPGFELEVAPGSVTFPGGGRSGLVTVTAVHADRIPMAPGAGMQPRLIVTIQPAGAHFDPPAPFTLPNVDGLAPGAVTELFSFDHDLGAFVAIGTGTVSEEGSIIRSDPSFGILEAGWHCGSPPSGSGGAATLDVDITTPKPLVLVADQNPACKAPIEATGGPPRDAVYSWNIGDSSVATLNPSGGGLCPNSAHCNTEATAVGAGQTIATVTITCTTTDSTSQDTIEVLVAKVEDVNVHTSDPETVKVPSVQPAGAQTLLHFVTARQQDDVVLQAEVIPDRPEVRDKVTWETSSSVVLTSPAVGGDRGTVSFTSNTAQGKKIPITIRIDGKVAKQIVAWVVSADMTGNIAPPVSAALTVAGGLRVGTEVSANIKPIATIRPADIISDTDRPDLSGPNMAPPPGGTNSCGAALSGGANAKWDISRRIIIRASTTPPGLPLACIDNPVNYPNDPAIGNDDAGTGDEDNDPYSAPGLGQLLGDDTPMRPGPNGGALRYGHVGDMYQSQLWFEEFARLELDGRWYIISDPLPWRVDFRLQKVMITEALWGQDVNGDGDLLDVVTEAMVGTDTNADGDVTDVVGFWDNNGSTSANDNAGHP
jgi:hypothetical protein